MKDIFRVVFSDVKRFIVIWLIVILLNQILIFHACFSTYCVIAAIPHTVFIAALITFLTKEKDEVERAPSTLFSSERGQKSFANEMLRQSLKESSVISKKPINKSNVSRWPWFLVLVLILIGAIAFSDVWYERPPILYLKENNNYVIQEGQKKPNYLFELLEKPSYLASWNKLFEEEDGVDMWLSQYAETLNGPSSPSKFIQLGSVSYEVSNVCMPHNCSNNRFIVLFSLNGNQAWGILLKNEINERFFGNPSKKQKRILRELASQ